MKLVKIYTDVGHQFRKIFALRVFIHRHGSLSSNIKATGTNPLQQPINWCLSSVWLNAFFPVIRYRNSHDKSIS